MSYGGGFLAGSQGNNDSPGGKRSGPSSLRPVTIHQVLNAEQSHPDAEFIIDGVEAKDVTLVACVRNFSTTATHVALLVEDGTGQIDVRQWVEASGDDEDKAYGIENNVYVRLLGTIKSFSGKRSINCTRARVIEDKNEILYHFAECAYVSMTLLKGPLTSATSRPNNDPYNADASNPYAAPAAATTTNGGGSSYAHLPMLQRQIMEYVSGVVASSTKELEGVHVNAILRSIGKKVPLEQLRTQIEQLANDGHLYCTIDDDHVLPTE